tara:strand:- start:644 stop:850 length:207 start_codon:yes stop_codon:yes gene_type:complete
MLRKNRQPKFGKAGEALVGLIILIVILSICALLAIPVYNSYFKKETEVPFLDILAEELVVPKDELGGN